ncbi:MAG: ATP-dependent sacrificial sulfur transferase LarE [Peptococcaceae bacterium]|nr:ATP-dependent sacrificial sulfur transferase LarE [Peptococcaceae bacterium]
MRKKLDRLRRILSGCESAVVAFSGGVDSTLLLKVAADVLGPRVTAATVDSPLAVPGELDLAGQLAGLIGVRQFVIKGKALADPGFRRNPPERCYICKRHVYTALWELARETGAGAVLDGANADDPGDFRPGLRAGREMGVRSPLLEAGLTKDEIRSLSREFGLPNWNRPAQPCLATRIPYGDPVDETKLLQIAKAEKFLYDRGYTAVRVRHHGPVARLELLPGEMGLFGDPGLREEIDTALKRLGFSYVVVDLAGLRSGSLNDLLQPRP